MIRPFLFFFSYAWRNRGRPLERFFHDLAEEVRKLKGGPVEEVAFRDRLTLAPGADWSQDLFDALITSQVLVFLTSPDYILSDYCGQELQAFLDRIAKLQNLNPGAQLPLLLLPVIWVPVQPAALPGVLSHTVLENDTLPGEYAARGLESLAKQRDKTAYRTVVERLAARIIQSSTGDPLPHGDSYTSIQAVPNAFRQDQPKGREKLPPAPAPAERKMGVRCLYIVPKGAEVEELKTRQVTVSGKVRPLRTNTNGYSTEDGWHWQPYHPLADVAVGSIVQQLVIDLPYREVLLDDEDGAAWSADKIIERLERAAANDQIILVIVDAWAGYLQPYEDLLRKFDRAVPGNAAAVLVPWNEADPDAMELRTELENNLRTLFRSKYAGNQPLPFFKPRVTTLEEFRNTVPALVEMIRIGIETYRAAQRPLIEPTGPAPTVRSARDGVRG
jgi:FxsC-like protein